MAVPQTEPLHDATQHLEQVRLLRGVSLLMALASTGLTVPVFLTTHNQWETATTALFAVYSWGFFLAVRRGLVRRVALWMVVIVLILAVVSVIAFGSVRTSASFLFVGAIAAAGILLGRRALVWCVAFSATSLGGLTLMERAGWMRVPDMSAGLKTWLTQAATLCVVALIIYHARRQLEGSAERLRAELALRQRTEAERDVGLDRFARIFRNSPTPMLAQSGRNGVILDVNPAFERCYGYPRDAMIGQTDEALWADPGERQAYLEKLFGQRRAELQNVKGRRSNGDVFDAVISSEMGLDDDDRMVITTVSDMTEQRRAVERLRRSEERFAKAFRLSPLNMRITRLSDGQVLELNQPNDLGELALQERSSDERAPLTIWRDAADRATYVQAMLTDGQVRGWERTLQLPDGRQRVVRLWSERIDIEGEACALSCVIDVTREVKRERLLREIAMGMATRNSQSFFGAMVQHLAHAVDADGVRVAELNADGQINELAAWSNGAEQVPVSCGIDGTPCGQLVAQGNTLVIADELPEHYPDAPALRTQGLRAYMGHCLLDDDGRVIGLVSVFFKRALDKPDDQTTLLSIFASRSNAELLRMRRDQEVLAFNDRLELRVRERTAELEKLNAELDAFAYSVSHDLKSPLRAIDGFTQLLRDGLQDRLRPDETELFTRVLAATHRMSTLIADMLALARVSQDRMQRQQVNLSTLATEVMAQLQARHPHRLIQASIEPGLIADCDPRLMRIALENLLGNAVKYTRDRGTAHIRFGRVPCEDGSLASHWYQVRDNGAGFDMTYADKLFKPFQRLHMPSSGFQGTGIGLATVHRIIERHGGRVSAQGWVDQGAEFRFTLSPSHNATELGKSEVSHG